MTTYLEFSGSRFEPGRTSIPALPDIQKKAGIVEGTSLYHENGYYETVDLLAADMEALNQINKPRLIGDGEVTAFSGNQIILPDRFTSKYGIEKGDTVTLQINGSPVDFEVAEIAAYDTVFLRHTRGATALLPLETIKEVLGWEDGYSKILIEPAPNSTTGNLISELKNALDNGKYRVSEVVNESQTAADARQKSLPFFLISFFSLTMSIFIIYSSYKVITLDRLPIFWHIPQYRRNRKDRNPYSAFRKPVLRLHRRVDWYSCWYDCIKRHLAGNGQIIIAGN